MPQLDKITLVDHAYGFILLFIVFYFYLIRFILPKYYYLFRVRLNMVHLFIGTLRKIKFKRRYWLRNLGFSFFSKVIDYVGWKDYIEYVRNYFFRGWKSVFYAIKRYVILQSYIRYIFFLSFVNEFRSLIFEFYLFTYNINYFLCRLNIFKVVCLKILS